MKAILVHHRGDRLLQSCIESPLRSALRQPLPATVRDPRVQVIRSPRPLGFGAANNLGLCRTAPERAPDRPGQASPRVDPPGAEPGFLARGRALATALPVLRRLAPLARAGRRLLQRRRS